MNPIGKKSSGFTLIEMMVAVGIVGILLIIAMPNLQTMVAKSRQSEAKFRLSSLHSRQKQFYSVNYAYSMGFSAVGFRVDPSLTYYVYTMCWPSGYGGTVSGYIGSLTDTETAQPTATLGNVAIDRSNIATACPVNACGSVGNNPQTYIATATASLCLGCYRDVWQIDHAKNLINCQIGLSKP